MNKKKICGKCGHHFEEHTTIMSRGNNCCLGGIACKCNQFRPTKDAQDGAKRPLTGRNSKPTNVLADGTMLPIAPPVI